MSGRVAILNGGFDALTLEATVAETLAAADAGGRGWLCTVNVATLMTMRNDSRLQSFVDRARWVVADGQPLVWCAPLFGGRLPERVAGIDLLDALCLRAAREGKGVYLLGTTSALLERAMAGLRRRHPTLRVDGASGFFPDDASAQRADAIRASGAAFLFVGMGSPRQERFIDQHWERLGVAVAIGVGGSFDVIAGARLRAHPWLGKAGLEWLARLIQEPRRLLPRYLVTNTRFCLLIAATIVERVRRWAAARG